MNWWVHNLYQAGQTVELFSWIFWVISSIVLHELAHGWAALWQGDDTPRRLGRMTVNPLVHMGTTSLLIFALIGLAWGAMPVNPGRFRNRSYGDVLVSLAGPAMNILLSLAALTGLSLWLRFGSTAQPLHENVATFLWTGGWLNIILALLNLLPIPPLDGSRILAGLSRKARELYNHPQAQLFGMFMLMAIFFTPIGDIVFYAASRGARLYVNALGALLGGSAA
ncbi:MAG: site-2 protease family protein [Planctomycetes bacterium]|nr:site-2 protease family protein [Planctomycetota bacterium]